MVKFPKRITVPVDEEMYEKIDEMRLESKDPDGNPLPIGTFCRRIFQMFIDRVGE